MSRGPILLIDGSGTLVDSLIPLPENVLSLSASQRVWNGVSVSITDFHCTGRVVHRLPYETETRLSVVLEEVGGRCEPRLRENKPCAIAHTPRHMHFAPAGQEAWGFSDDIRYVVKAGTVYEADTLDEVWPVARPYGDYHWVDPEMLRNDDLGRDVVHVSSDDRA